MAVGAVLPLFNMLLMQIDMDSCLGLSRGVLQNNLCLVQQRSAVTQAPSGCSSTMVNPTQEHEDSGISQSAPELTSPPQQQQQTAHDSAAAAALAAREVSLPLSEAQDTTHRSQVTEEGIASERTCAPLVSTDKNPNPSNPAAGLEGQASGEGETPAASEEAEGGPPKKRARTIPEDKEESSAVERSHSQRQSADAGPSISLGRFPSERETGASHSRSQVEAKPWWLTSAPAALPAASLQPSSPDTGSADASLQRVTHQLQQHEQQQQRHQEQQRQEQQQEQRRQQQLEQQRQQQQEQQRQQQQLQQLQQQQLQQLHQQQIRQQQQLQQQQQQQHHLQQRQQEREFFPKQPPVYDPDMLSSMESGHDRAGTTPGELGSSRDWPERPYLPPRHDTPELPFFTRRDSPGQRSSSAASGHSGEEGPPRPASSGQSKGKESAILDTLGHGTHMAEIGHKGLPARHPSPVEAQQPFPAPLHGTPFLSGGQGQSGFASPGVNPSFYARFLATVPHDTPPMFIPPVSHVRPAQGIPGQRPLGHLEMGPSSFMQPPSNELAMQKLAATAPPFLPRFQPSDAPKLGFPYAPYDVMQSPQRPQQLPVGRPGPRGPAPGMAPPFDMRHGSGHFLPPFSFPLDPQRPVPQVPLPSRPSAAGGFQHLLPPSQGPPAYGRPGLNWGHFPGTDIATDLHVERAGGFDAVQPPQVSVPITVAFDGRDLGWRINLQELNSYESFATQLRALCYSNMSTAEDISASSGVYNLSTAIPGYQITYEDEEGDTLLAGDTSWREFVRLAKRIKILALRRRPPRPAGTS